MEQGIRIRTVIILWWLLSGVLSIHAQSSADWTEISDNIPMSLPDGDFLDVHFVGDEGWITFDELYNNNGVILYTDNAGLSFSILSFPEIPNVIEMVNAEIGFVGCLSGKVYSRAASRRGAGNSRQSRQRTALLRKGLLNSAKASEDD